MLVLPVVANQSAAGLLWRNRAGASKASRRIAALLLEQGLERVGA